MDAEQRQVAADLWTKPTDLSHKPACRQLRHYIHHRHLLLLSVRCVKPADKPVTLYKLNELLYAGRQGWTGRAGRIGETGATGASGRIGDTGVTGPRGPPAVQLGGTTYRSLLVTRGVAVICTSQLFYRQSNVGGGTLHFLPHHSLSLPSRGRFLKKELWER